MDSHYLHLAATLTVLAAIGTLPPLITASLVGSATMSSVAAADTGNSLHDPQGATIRSFHRFVDDGRATAILVGSYLRSGNHEPQVSAQPLPLADNKITLKIGTKALNY